MLPQPDRSGNPAIAEGSWRAGAGDRRTLPVEFAHDGTPLTGQQNLQLALRGFIRRVVVDPAGRPVAISSRQRCLTGPLRDILLGLARTCRFPGCDTPAHRCELDHIEPWRTTRETHAANDWPLCDHHQKLKEAGFTPHPHPDGTTHWTRPDGTRLDE